MDADSVNDGTGTIRAMGRSRSVTSISAPRSTARS
jgi:hypothetical protein